MRILVLNTGSSSVKFSVFDMLTGEQHFKGEIERVDSIDVALAEVGVQLKAAAQDQFAAIGHRVAHGGEKFHCPTLLDDQVVQAIIECVPLAPLHNPPILASIAYTRAQWPLVPQVAVFDTAFHHAMPKWATTYAVPQSWRERGLRRYGFHGTSHQYVMERVASELHTPASDLRIISCHLGNGASVCAIDRGISVDTSMGMTALEGLVMGTRSGDVDPGVFRYLGQTLNLDLDSIEDALYLKSGLLGLSGISNDMRDIEQRAADGDKHAQLAIQVYAYRVQKYIGAYAAAMRGVDVLAFTGGIGENSASMRKRICAGLEFLGLYFSDEQNMQVKLVGFEAPALHQDNSRVKVLVTQTREQWMIAKEAYRLLNGSKKHHAQTMLPAIPVAVSAHHIHLTQGAVDALFGVGYQLCKRNDLSEPNNWAAEETLDVLGPRGKLHGLRILGPCREYNQIEIAETETFLLGIDAPVRLSGHTEASPVVTLVGPKGSMQTNGLIVAQRHIHMSPADADLFAVKQGDLVEVEIANNPRGIVFRDVAIRVDPQFVLEMHIDTDEANAALISNGGEGELMATKHHAKIVRTKAMTH